MESVKSKIRINDLARELEVKSRSVLDYLLEIGVTDKKSHSSAIDDDVAERVRVHFRELGPEAEEPTAPESRPAPEAPAPVPTTAPEPAPARSVVQKPAVPKFAEGRHDSPVVGRTLEQIKAEARLAVAPVHKPAPPAGPLAPRPAASPVAPGSALRPMKPAAPAAGPVSAPPRAGLARLRAAETIGMKPGVAHRPPATAHGAAAQPARTEDAPPARPVAAAPAGSPARGHVAASPGGAARSGRMVPPGRKAPASDQPIYPGVTVPRPVPGRGTPSRRPGEHRPMHPTARPAGGAAPAAGPAAGVRPYAPRSGQMPSRQMPSRTPSPFTLPKPVVPEEVPITRKITVTEGVTIKELSERLEVRAKDVIKRLLEKG
ncbi:MAG: translation initiation factor IF-2 N-terminal domain-containing protein, partial [Terriglobia bacterium]